MSYIDFMANDDRKQIVERASLASLDRITADAVEDGFSNEIRANWGQAGVMLACPDYARSKNGIETDVSDALCNIMHFMSRAGLDFDEMFERAKTSHQGDLEDAEDAAYDAVMFPHTDR